MQATRAFTAAPTANSFAVSSGLNPSQPSSIICPSCGLSVEEGGDFCEHCGARAVAAIVDPPSPPPVFSPLPSPAPPPPTEAIAPTVIGYATNIEQEPFHEPSTNREQTTDNALDAHALPPSIREDAEMFGRSAATKQPDVSIPETPTEAIEEVEIHAATGDKELDVSGAAHDSPPHDVEPSFRAWSQSGEPEVRSFSNSRNKKTSILVLSAVMMIVFVAIAGFAVWYSQGHGSSIVQNSSASPSPSLSPPTEGGASPPTRAPDGMVLIPGGSFSMGRAGDEYERPVHVVTVQPFYMDRYEVTCEQYARFIEATGYPPPPTWPNGRHPEGAARQPVTGINWLEANAYAQWAGRRLPTEEEWEYAARGTDGRAYPWGNEWRPDLANANGTIRRFDEVGSRPGNASPFGVYDMVGNAWEWTSNDMRAYPGGVLPQQPSGVHKVLRGGCWESSPEQATATYRFGWLAQGASDYNNTGFRCAMSVNVTPNNR